MNEETTAAPRDLSVPLAAPPKCFPCVAAICGHRHCDGTIPALTYFEGTGLCQDCASPVAISRWRAKL